MPALEFIPERHEYRFDGLTVPNVTSILEPLLDFGAVPADILERARDVGTAVHFATELDDAGDLFEPSVDPVVAPYLAAWRRFRDETRFVPKVSEARVFSKRHWFAGTLDRLGLFDFGLEGIGVAPDDLCMIDIKATAAMPPSAGPQTAAYTEAWNALRGNPKVRRRFAVQLKPDGTYRLQEFSDKRDLPVFLSCLTIHNWRASR